MRRREPNLRSTRLSRSFYPVDSPVFAERMQAALPVEGYYTYLLYQDLDHVYPYGTGRGNPPGVQVVGPNAERAAPLIGEALSDRSFPSLDDGLRKFVSTTAQALVFGGPCTYEIDYLCPADEAGADHPVAFGLELIQPGTFSTIDGAPIQYVLPTLSEKRDPTGLPYVSLEQSTLVTFTLPQDLVAPVRTVIEFLVTANQEQTKEFALKQRALTEPTPYEFSAHMREKAELFAEVTQPIGWNVRDLFKDNQLEPFGVWRQIRFLEFKVRVRDAIIDRLNQAIDQVGKKMGFSATIEVVGLPTLEDVRVAKEDFRTGGRGLADIGSATL